MGADDGDGGTGGAARVIAGRLARTHATSHLAAEVAGGSGGSSGRATKAGAPVPSSGDAGDLVLELPSADDLARWGIAELPERVLDAMIAEHL